MKIDEFYHRLKAHPRLSRLVAPPIREIWRYGRDLRRLLPLQHIPGLKEWSGRPIGIWPETVSFIREHPDQGSVHTVYPAGTCNRSLPADLGEGVSAAQAAARGVAWPGGTVLELRQVRLVGGYGGSVITSDNRLLGDLSRDVWGIHRHALFSRIRWPKARSLPGLTAMLATPEARENYSHWLFELLPRLLLIEQAGWKLADFDYFVVNIGAASYGRETLAAFGIPPEKILPLDRQDVFRARQVVTASMPSEHWKDSLPPFVVQQLVDRLTAGAWGGSGRFPKRIYLSRAWSSFRRLTNEAELLPILSAHGFEVFAPDRHTLAEQIAAFRGAEAVAAPHGSAMSNIIFCRPGTPVLEMLPHRHQDFSFWTLASHAALRYAAVVGEPLGIPPQKENLGSRFLDFEIDPRRFKNGLDWIERNRGR